MTKRNNVDPPSPLYIPSELRSSLLREYQIVLIGDGGVGKTNITNQFVHSAFTNDYDPTIEDAYRKMVSVDEQRMVLEVIDTAGQKEFAAMRTQTIRSGEGFIGIYAVDSVSSFKSIQKLYQHIQDIKSESLLSSKSKIGKKNCTEKPRVPFVLVANKCDLDPSLKRVTTAQGMALAKELHCPFLECSAKFAMNTDLVFDTIVREMKQNRQLSVPLTPPATPRTSSLDTSRLALHEKRKHDCCMQ